jgi:Gpi18-like mannosyltransferase
VTTIFTHVGVGGEIDRWDSRWFIRAAEFGWPTQLPHHNGHVAANTIAFLPVFPLSFRWLSHLTGFSLLTSGVIVTSLSGLTAMIGVWMVIRAYSDQDAADRGTLLVAMFPGTFVLSMVYSEGLVITFVAFGILALMRRRWLLAGLLGMLATATTPIALAFEVSCLWCAYRQITKDRDWRSLVAPILTPLGFLAFQVWLWIHTGNLSAWRATERGGWKSYPSIAYAVHTVGVVLRDPIATNKTDDLLFVGTVLTVVAAVIAIRSRMPMPLLLFGLVAAGVAFVSAPVGLRPRFMLLAFPLIIAVGTRFRGRAYVWLVSISMVLLIFATAYEVSSWAVFP